MIINHIKHAIFTKFAAKIHIYYDICKEIEEKSDCCGFFLPQPGAAGSFFYLTRPLLLGEAPQPLLNPPLLRREGLKAWPAGPVRANKLSPLKGLLVIVYAIELRLF